MHLLRQLVWQGSYSYYRAGPGTFDVTPKDSTKPVVHIHHWFDGLSLLHKFELHPNNGGVEYSSRANASGVRERIEEKVLSLLYFLRLSTVLLLVVACCSWCCCCADKLQGEIDRITFGRLSDPCESLFRKVVSFFFTMGSMVAHKPEPIGPQGANILTNHNYTTTLQQQNNL